MDEDTSLRTLAIYHPLEPDAEESVHTKARDARNVLHIRGVDVDLAIRSSCEGALIDGLPADKVKAGDEREISR